MWRSAAMRRPLRSKRAMISPVRLRANASGFTRIRVRDMSVYSVGSMIQREERGGSATVSSEVVLPRRRRRPLEAAGGVAPVSASQ